MNADGTRTVHFLLVDDDDFDQLAIRRAFQELRLLNPVHTACDGEAALALLRGDGVEAVPRPVVVLLDLNMPRMNGVEFLRALRESPDLADIPVAVLTTSGDEADRHAVARYGVQVYRVKSDAVSADVLAILDRLSVYWRIVEVPLASEPR